MAQINIAVDDQMVTQLDRIAAARGVRRPDLLRATLTELIEAHDAGRLAFAASDGPRVETSLNALSTQLREAVVELDRAQRENRRQAKRLLESWNGGEQAVGEAQRRISATVAEQYRHAIAPVLTRLDTVANNLARSPEAVADALGQRFAQIARSIEANNHLAAQPRVQHNLLIGAGEPIRLSLLGALAAVVMAVGAVALLEIAELSDSLAVTLSTRMLTDSSRVCRLLARQYGTRDCSVPLGERKVGIRVINTEGGL